LFLGLAACGGRSLSGLAGLLGPAALRALVGGCAAPLQATKPAAAKAACRTF